MKCQLYTIRIVCFLLVLGLLGGAIYAIILSVSASTDPVSKTFIVIATIMTLIKSFLSLIEHKTATPNLHFSRFLISSLLLWTIRTYIYIYIQLYCPLHPTPKSSVTIRISPFIQSTFIHPYSCCWVPDTTLSYKWSSDRQK